MKKCISPPGNGSDLGQACQVVVPHFTAAPGIVVDRVGRAVLAQRSSQISAWGSWCWCYVFFRDVFPVLVAAMQCACSELIPLGRNKKSKQWYQVDISSVKSFFGACCETQKKNITFTPKWANYFAHLFN